MYKSLYKINVFGCKPNGCKKTSVHNPAFIAIFNLICFALLSCLRVLNCCAQLRAALRLTTYLHYLYTRRMRNTTVQIAAVACNAIVKIYFDENTRVARNGGCVESFAIIVAQKGDSA